MKKREREKGEERKSRGGVFRQYGRGGEKAENK
jgi:hypothetical protein